MRQRSAAGRRPSGMHLLRVVAALVLACAAAGCRDGAAEEVARHVGTYDATGEGGDAALLEGTVRLDGGCFLVETAVGGRFLVAFPRDEVAWRDGGLRRAGRTYAAGDRIALAGGSGAEWPVPRACRGARASLPWWTVAQSG